jgi:hypothetical protein
MKLQHTFGALVCFSSMAYGQIAFDGYPFAKTSLNSDGKETIITPENVGAQIFYTKQQGAKGPLVSVYLLNEDKGVDLLLAKDFDMMAQKCSCYWIDYYGVSNLTAADGKPLPDGLEYRVGFVEQVGREPRQWLSGLFGMALSSDNLPALVNPIVSAASPNTTSDKLDKRPKDTINVGGVNGDAGTIGFSLMLMLTGLMLSLFA